MSEIMLNNNDTETTQWEREISLS